jgi:hypothetical protein
MYFVMPLIRVINIYALLVLQIRSITLLARVTQWIGTTSILPLFVSYLHSKCS